MLSSSAAKIDCSLEVAAEFTAVVPLLQITVKREKEHEAASFCLIASFGGIADLDFPTPDVRC